MKNRDEIAIGSMGFAFIISMVLANFDGVLYYLNKFTGELAGLLFVAAFFGYYTAKKRKNIYAMMILCMVMIGCTFNVIDWLWLMFDTLINGVQSGNSESWDTYDFIFKILGTIPALIIFFSALNNIGESVVYQPKWFRLIYYKLMENKK